ncbi:MAG: cupin domain-containing protein [Bacteroidales bacterium]|nr:cupin domain-containing protein [Bacteroidales bacterium]
MIKTKDQIAIQVVENSGNIKGRIEKNHILTPEEMGGRAHMFARIDIPAGSMIMEHAHTADAEAYYILEGELTVTDNDTTRTLHPGDVLFTADGNLHSIENRTSQPGAFLAIIFKN